MKLKSILTTSYRVRIIADVVLTFTFIAIMYARDAPSWAIALALLLATRLSRWDHASDVAILQTTIRALADELECDNMVAQDESLSENVRRELATMNRTTLPGVDVNPENPGGKYGR